MAQHRQVLLKNIDFPDQAQLSGYESRDGYKSMRKALGIAPAELVELVKKSGLRGRGGAGFPTGLKWSFVPQNTGKPIYVLMNADESEPGTFKDRLLLERDPHACIEGLMIAAHALNSEWACIYIRGEYTYAYTVLYKAIKECYENGYLGGNIFGSGRKLDMAIHRGAGAYICGEETALINSLEGKKGQPRLKPPFPAIQGLYDCPTVVNNVETLAALPFIIENGAEAYLAIGTEKSPGTKLFSASGHIKKPGVYEVELGYPLLDFLNNECGGMLEGSELKAVIPGGSSVPILRADELKNITLDYESLRDAGTLLGSGGFIVIDHKTDMVEMALNLAHFYAHESCGQCTPCREGGHWIEKIFNRVSSGAGLPGDIELILSACSQIAGHTICPFGDALATPAQSFIQKFPEEFKERIKDLL
jgi:NADH-quinone oxidoreductase subunit F